jgi:hypothetical protein
MDPTIEHTIIYYCYWAYDIIHHTIDHTIEHVIIHDIAIEYTNEHIIGLELLI